MTDIDAFDDEAPDELDEPDFAALYEPHINADGWRMTPRMAWRLWTAAQYLADECGGAARARHRCSGSSLRFAHDYFRARTWRGQFVAGFDRVAERIGGVDNGDVLARCTAEELALHLIIDLAEADYIDGAISPAAACHLPGHGENDEDFNWMRVLFEDHDVLMLFGPALDGVEHDPELATAYLHPRDWFSPFREWSAAS